MFRYSCTRPAEIAGTIELTKRPSGLGTYTDIHGKRWDIHGIIGDYVQACPLDEVHPYYNDTSGNEYDFVSQTWLPYEIAIKEAA